MYKGHKTNIPIIKSVVCLTLSQVKSDTEVSVFAFHQCFAHKRSKWVPVSITGETKTTSSLNLVLTVYFFHFRIYNLENRFKTNN